MGFFSEWIEAYNNPSSKTRQAEVQRFELNEPIKFSDTFEVTKSARAVLGSVPQEDIIIEMWQHSKNLVLSPETKGNKTMEEIIQEIHDSFYSEMENLKENAMQMNSLYTEKQALIDKVKRLEQFGFTNTEENILAKEEIERLDILEKENKKKQELLEAINYFSQKYPTYKFITEDSVKKLCAKYGLIYGEVSKYKGKVPDKNLQEIEKFRIDENDRCHDWKIYVRYGDKITDYPLTQLSNGKPEVSHINNYKYLKETYKEIELMNPILTPLPFEIAAPPSDFDLLKHEIKDFKLVVKDPIVFCPVFYNKKKHYLIVTAWGLESKDDLVQNPVHN